MRALAVLLVVPVLAGCLGDDAPDTRAQDAARISHDEAERRYEYVLFLGITGTEGDLDWDQYEAALEASASPGPAIAHAFDQDRDYGELADGRLGSWLTTHFAYDEERRLIGGLYTQILADGTRDAIFASFKGPYAGTTALPDLQNRQAALAVELAARETAPVLCTLVTDTASWNVDSDDAATTARQVPEVQAHMEKYPDGEFTYHYFPGLGVEEDCPATLEATGNTWTIYHTDLDAYLGEGPTPTAARVEIDAATGEVTDIDVGPLFLRPPQVIEARITAQDPLVPRNVPVMHNLTVPVEPGAQRFQLTAFRTQQPEFTTSAETVLRMPDGRIWERHDFASASIHRYVIDDPSPGDWSLEYRYRSLHSDGQHVVELHGIIEYV